jgi:hypothetical protein
MNHKLELQNNAEIIYQSIEEVHVLLSALEEQIKLGLFAVQSEIETVEVVTPQEQSFCLEDGSLSTH